MRGTSSSQTAMSTSLCGRVDSADVEVHSPSRRRASTRDAAAASSRSTSAERRELPRCGRPSIRDEREARPLRREVFLPQGLVELVRRHGGNHVSPANSASISVSSELVGVGERRGVELGATDDVGHAVHRRAGEALRRATPARSAPSRAPLLVARDDHVSPAGERAEALGQRVPGLATHDDRIAHGDLPEMRHVLRADARGRPRPGRSHRRGRPRRRG